MGTRLSLTRGSATPTKYLFMRKFIDVCKFAVCTYVRIRTILVFTKAHLEF